MDIHALLDDATATADECDPDNLQQPSSQQQEGLRADARRQTPPLPRHLNLAPACHDEPAAVAAEAEERAAKPARDSLSDVLMCCPELLDDQTGANHSESAPLDARLLLFQLLSGLVAAHAAGAAHGSLQLSDVLLHDRQ